MRTSGYLAGQNDVYVSMNLVRRYGLRRGDAVTGAVKVPRTVSRPTSGRSSILARLDTVNGGDPGGPQTSRVQHKLTPLYPNQRLRLKPRPSVSTPASST